MVQKVKLEIPFTNVNKFKAHFQKTKVAKKKFQRLLERIDWPLVKKVLNYPKTNRIEIILVSGEEIASLNQSYYHKSGPTDVLSFQYLEEGLIGEVYICLEQVAKQSKIYHNDFRDEFLTVLVHGILHCLGFKHDQPMFRKQKQIVDKLKQELNEINSRLG